MNEFLDNLKKELGHKQHDNKNQVLKLLGDRCIGFVFLNVRYACQWVNKDGTTGCTDHDMLHIDHVQNDGAKDRKGFVWARRLKEIQEGSDRYQILCANCNMKKEVLLQRHFDQISWGFKQGSMLPENNVTSK